jgi:hypothetical protein
VVVLFISFAPVTIIIFINRKIASAQVSLFLVDPFFMIAMETYRNLMFCLDPTIVDLLDYFSFVKAAYDLTSTI